MCARANGRYTFSLRRKTEIIYSTKIAINQAMAYLKHAWQRRHKFYSEDFNTEIMDL